MEPSVVKADFYTQKLPDQTISSLANKAEEHLRRPTPSTEATQIIACNTGGFTTGCNATQRRAREAPEARVYRLPVFQATQLAQFNVQ